MSNAFEIPSIPAIPVDRSCVLDERLHTLDWLLKWRADVRLGGTVHQNVVVAELMKAALADPAAFDLSPEEAKAAAESWLKSAWSVLESVGGERAWLEKELRTDK